MDILGRPGEAGASGINECSKESGKGRAFLGRDEPPRLASLREASLCAAVRGLPPQRPLPGSQLRETRSDPAGPCLAPA